MTIEEKLREKLRITHLEVADESHQHAGHNPSAAEGGTHFRVLIVSPDFEGKTLVERHRTVNDAVFGDASVSIHALAIKAFTPFEWSKK
jgi:BolA family transcriptional regulator, general stress-responsive regulator